MDLYEYCPKTVGEYEGESLPGLGGNVPDGKKVFAGEM